MDVLAELMSLADEARAQAAASSRPGQLDALESIADRLLALRVRLRAELDRLTAERQTIESAVTDYADSCEHGGDLAGVVLGMAKDLQHLRYTVLTDRTVERDEARAEVKRLRQQLADAWDATAGLDAIARREALAPLYAALVVDYTPPTPAETEALTRVADAIADVVITGREVLDPKAGA